MITAKPDSLIFMVRLTKPLFHTEARRHREDIFVINELPL